MTMKKNALLSGLILAFVSISLFSNATVWRVNSAPGSAAQYVSVQAAHDATTTLNNDTLYVEASATTQGPLSCSKKLVIIGTGYFLAQNPQTQSTPVASTIDYIYFNAGSQGSKVMGISTGYIYINTSNLLITRNYISGAGYPIYGQAANLGNIVITQNYIQGSAYYSQAIYFPYAANNILITNNYIQGYVSSGTNFAGIFENNVVFGYIALYNTTLKNNILTGSYGNFTNYNCIYTNNISYNSDFGTANGNQANVVMSNVFAGTATTNDGYFKLKAGSPALGAGENGVDCGMYGGPFPYILSGMPNIPSIYYFNAPSIPSNTINVAIKAKSHN